MTQNEWYPSSCKRCGHPHAAHKYIPASTSGIGMQFDEEFHCEANSIRRDGRSCLCIAESNDFISLPH